MPDALIYTRRGCHLCHEAERKLRRVATEYSLRVRLVDVDEDPALRSLYGDRVPVIVAFGRVLDEGNVTEYRLRQSLERN